MTEVLKHPHNFQPPARVGLVVLGNGGHAKVVIEILEAMNRFEILGCCSSDPNPPKTVAGYPFLGDFAVLRELACDGVHEAAVGIGGWTDNVRREAVFLLAKEMGYRLVKAVHPSAVVAPNVHIGDGSIIGAAAIVMTEASIGDNVIVSSGAFVGHETVVGDHVLLSGAAKIGANATIMEHAVIAFGATVLSRVTVGRNALVAAGAVAVKDVPDNTRVFGIPARPRDTHYP
jgi:UDP-perosamine 4-acetyltransferase